MKHGEIRSLRMCLRRRRHVCDRTGQAALSSSRPESDSSSSSVQSIGIKHPTCVSLLWPENILQQVSYTPVVKAELKPTGHALTRRPIDFRWTTMCQKNPMLNQTGNQRRVMRSHNDWRDGEWQAKIVHVSCRQPPPYMDQNTKTRRHLFHQHEKLHQRHCNEFNGSNVPYRRRAWTSVDD